MKIFEANITHQVSSYLNAILKEVPSFKIANKLLLENVGIKHFFDTETEFELLKDFIADSTVIHAEEPDRAEYGDFQTNEILSNKVALNLSSKGFSPTIIIEPTCGKGNFIIASLKNFSQINFVYGIEIYKPYVWETKFNIINYYLNYPTTKKPEISIIHCNVFDFDFDNIAKQFVGENILIIGNPPWVTNAKLGSLNSINLPRKVNFKNHSGLDAMTGKGNFDIAEFITITMLNTFQNMKGELLFLVKNSVIKNIVFEQKKNKYTIGTIEKYCIDSKKEFNVSVEAALFCCKLNANPEFICTEFNFYDNKIPYLKFGWLDNKFVSDIDNYTFSKKFDGECPFVWRQGLKHDCSSIMELDKKNGHYTNGLEEQFNIEEGLVFGFLKSSDLKNSIINQTRKYTIVTQRKVGQETTYIKTNFPKTYQYLVDHKDYFESRKSSIYNNKPSFSIFGIGDYSFKPFKVAISGLYKTYHFTLVLPQDNKPVMLDDTCYFIGFDNIEFAVYTLLLLNSDNTKKLLKSITFPDAKRTFTKDLLMRIDLLALSTTVQLNELTIEIKKMNTLYNLSLSLNLWGDYLKAMTPIISSQTEMFA